MGFNMRTSKGFTLVEMLIALSVLAIIVVLLFVSFGAWQRKTVTTKVSSDLLNASSTMGQINNFNNRYPTTIEELFEHFRPSEGVELRLVSKQDGPAWPPLDDLRNALLFYEICHELTRQGFGSGKTAGGTTESYIGNCQVYGNDYIQFQGNSVRWQKTLHTPVNESDISDFLSYIDTVPIENESTWAINERSTARNFYTTLNKIFLAFGGKYPVTTFWDGSWCQPTSTGCTTIIGVNLPQEIKDELPNAVNRGELESNPGKEETNDSKPNTFCLEAQSLKYSDIIHHITNTMRQPQAGPC